MQGADSIPPRLKMQVGGKAQPLSFDASGASQPLLISASTGWVGVPFELHQTQPTNDVWHADSLDAEPQLRIVVDGSVEILQRRHGKDVLRRLSPGSMSFHCGGGPTCLRVVGSAKAVAVDLSPAWLARMLHDGGPSRLQSYAVPEPDATARSLALAMCAEASSGAPTGTLFAESLSLALVSYALDRLPSSQMRVHGTLSEGQCRRLRRHIDERLAEDVRLSDLAAMCGLGPRHFTTLFRRAFGVPPHRYVLDRRLAHGARLLAQGGYDISEIALRAGFSSQSHFTTAFRQAHGVTPRAYAAGHRRIMSTGG